MIISGGFNVDSAEVQQALMRHPDVQDGAVLQLRPGHELSPQPLQAFMKARIGSVKTPKLIEVWPDLPRSSVDKVTKRDIRERMLKRSESD